MGIGEPETPRAFVNACDVFVDTKNLGERETDASGDEADWRKTVRQAVIAAAREDGWANLGAVGSMVRQLDPAFDPRSFGHRQLSALVESDPAVFRTRMSKNGQGAAVKLRDWRASRRSGQPRGQPGVRFASVHYFI